jgi:signal transduction histidine kinase
MSGWVGPRPRSLDRRSSAHKLGAKATHADDPPATPPTTTHVLNRSTITRAQQLAFEAAESRVLESLKINTAERPSRTRRLVVLAVAAALFALTFAARLAIDDPDALIANFYVVPIALLAIEFGTRGGVIAAAVALGLVFAWSVLQAVHLGVLGYTARGAALLVSGAVVGRFADRLREDVAERRRAQRHMSLYADQLTRANQQLAQSVERLVATERLRLSIDAAEQARARWARELHDQTLQGLAGARMVLAAGLARDDPEALRRAAETADVHIGAEARSLRDLITELRPAALDDLGLGPAIESLAKRQAAAAGFALDMNIDLGPHERPREIEDAIYRIVQEALSNVVRHAGAEQATLSVRQLPRHVEVTVQDDGCGFAPDGPSEGFGLIGMRERADLLDGELSLRSRDGGPTCVTAVLPLPA